MITFKTLADIISHEEVRNIRVLFDYNKEDDIFHSGFSISTDQCEDLMSLLDQSLVIEEVELKKYTLDITARRK